MTFYRDAFVAAGTLTLAYLLLRIIRNQMNQDSTNASDSSNCSEEVVEDINTENKSLEAKNSQLILGKRKQKVTEEVMKIPKQRYNFFFGFPVYDVGIHQKIKNLQEKIIAQTPSLHPALVNVSTLHVTLAVTHLKSKKDIKIAKEKLDEWVLKNKESFFMEPIILNFRTVKTFNDVVAYVDIDRCENYKKLIHLSESLKTMLSSVGFSTDKKDTIPHLTLLKLSKDFRLVKKKKHFKHDFEVLKQCQEEFGKQEVSHIQLLSMDEPKDKNGYYKCFHQINISNTKLDVDHSICCSPIPKPKLVDIKKS